MSAAREWPVVRSGGPLDCFLCGGSLPPALEVDEGAAAGQGQFSRRCGCGVRTFYDHPAIQPAPVNREAERIQRDLDEGEAWEREEGW